MDVDTDCLTLQSFGIQSVPALLFFAAGQISKTHIGTISRDKLNEMIEQL